jgi:hypothetical protein
MGTSEILPQAVVESKILFIRGKKIMLDKDLAVLYGVETRALNQAVKRNLKRFPPDFMFQLTKEEMINWTSQIVISNKEKMGLRKTPYAFTENGVAMLSSVLNSERAITVNIQIMRTFTKIREMLLSNAELARKIESLERKYDSQFAVVFDAIRQLMIPPETKKKKIGFGRECE